MWYSLNLKSSFLLINVTKGSRSFGLSVQTCLLRRQNKAMESLEGCDCNSLNQMSTRQIKFNFNKING